MGSALVDEGSVEQPLSGSEPESLLLPEQEPPPLQDQEQEPPLPQKQPQEPPPGSLSAMVLRWRVHNGELLLRRRHIRELERLGLPAPLMGWVHERLDWAVANMLSKDSEAVLVLDVDPATEVKLSLEEARPLPVLSIDDLLLAGGTGGTAAAGLVCGVEHNGQPLAGTVWAERDGQLFASCTELVAAADTLTGDLASTLGIPLTVAPLPVSGKGLQKWIAAPPAAARNDEGAHVPHAVQSLSWFLISDEFGFVAIEPYDASKSPRAERLRQALSQMW